MPVGPGATPVDRGGQEAALPDVLQPSAIALREILAAYVVRQLPHRRVARLAGLLLLAGAGIEESLYAKVRDYLLSCQHPDGGWVDCEDTAWCTYVLAYNSLTISDPTSPEVIWLEGERVSGAWGYCQRDRPCIPITGTIRFLLPSLRDDQSASWLRKAWAADLDQSCRLSYKAAWFLLAQDKDPIDCDLDKQTVEHLLRDQRDDGGWGPWRDHPAPTDCFSTGIAMRALSIRAQDNAIKTSMTAAIEWCSRNRLPTGLFPTHFIEEGSAWLLVGWTAALRLFSGKPVAL